MTRNFYKCLKDNRETPEAMYVFEVLTKYYDSIQSVGYYCWDPLAAVSLTDHSLATFETRKLIVIEKEGDQSGRIQANEAASIRVAVDVVRERFEQLFLDTLKYS